MRQQSLGRDRVLVSRSQRIDDGRSLRVRFNDRRTVEASALTFLRMAYPDWVQAERSAAPTVDATYRIDEGERVRVHFYCAPQVDSVTFEAVDLHHLELELAEASEAVRVR